MFRAYDSLDSSDASNESIDLHHASLRDRVVKDSPEKPRNPPTVKAFFRCQRQREKGHFTVRVELLRNCPGTLIGLWYNCYVVAQLLLRGDQKRKKRIKSQAKMEVRFQRSLQSSQTSIFRFVSK